MKTSQMNIRIQPAQKSLLQQAAEAAHENFTEFLLNSAMLRIQNKQLGVKPVDPMEVMGQLFFEPYDEKKVSKKDAARIRELVEQDRRGELKYDTIGTVKVKPPKRDRQGRLIG
jgi:hypothetical protein